MVKLAELVVATRNRGKLQEIRELLTDVCSRVYSLDDFPPFPETIEDGETFEENARKKAMEAAEHTGVAALADDSGLLVDWLGGRPGVKSARYSGAGATEESNNRKLLSELAGVGTSFRGACFRCVAALAFPGGDCITFSGDLPGFILEEPRGSGGFGYDPLFQVAGQEKTLAEIPLEEKNLLSHRGRAIRELRRYLATGMEPELVCLGENSC